VKEVLVELKEVIPLVSIKWGDDMSDWNSK